MAEGSGIQVGPATPPASAAGVSLALPGLSLGSFNHTHHNQFLSLTIPAKGLSSRVCIGN